jgi:hypothetical protein
LKGRGISFLAQCSVPQADGPDRVMLILSFVSFVVEHFAFQFGLFGNFGDSGNSASGLSAEC